MHYVTIATIESGKSQGGDLETLKKLSAALNVKVSELSDAGHVSPMEPLVSEFMSTAWAREVLSPPLSADEVEWLLSLPGIFWNDIEPTHKTLYHLVEARRSTGK